ncbi:MAG TPA: ferritin [Phycisphaerae bacterium]|nr:ferritin [Phycisphaerae bacterium]
MLNEKIEKAFNEQLLAETYSAYLYWSMSACFDAMNLSGFANWMRVQAQEEMTHALKFYHFLIGRGGRVTLGAIEAPPAQWDSPLAVFEEVLAHERKVTGLINGLVEIAQAERDHATSAMLQWFITEQVEEEASADDVVQKLRLMADAPGGLFMLDRELAQRVFTPPAPQGSAQ